MRQIVFGIVVMTLATAACADGRGPQSPSAPSSTSAAAAGSIAAFAGTWTAAAGLTVGPCSGTTYSVTPTGTNSATITYSATCAGMAVAGSGSATSDGSTLAWTTTGTAGPCPFALNGTAVPAGSNLKVAYSGTVCGAPVSGSEALHK